MLTPCDSPAVFPPDVARASARFSVDDFTDAAALALGVHLPANLAGSVRKRRAEYVAGRHCAIRAIRMLLPQFAGDVPSAESRAPQWPPGTLGSITHAHGFASAAVVLASRARGIGLDTEAMLSRSALEAVRELAMHADEAPSAPFDLREEAYFALLFSAKESTFKCLNPLTGRTLGYKEARVRFDPGGTFDVEILTDLGDEIGPGTTIRGSWIADTTSVHTGLLLSH